MTNAIIRITVRYMTNDAGFEYNEFFMPAILDDDVSKERIIKKYTDHALKTMQHDGR